MNIGQIREFQSSISENGWILATLLFVAIAFAALLLCKRALHIRKNKKQAKLARQQREYVSKTSTAIARLLTLNQEYSDKFEGGISRTYGYRRKLNSKAKYDAFNARSTLISIIEKQCEAYEKAIHAVERNSALFESYKRACNEILSSSAIPADLPEDIFENHKSYLIEERRCFNNLLLKPTCDFTVRINWYYTSPAGRNNYHEQRVFSSNDVRSALSEIESREKRRRTAQYQREAMTPSLRFEVMKRDGYRCRICGKGQEDGVKLEADHIVPVSRGGKTELSNLQTLCWDCNRGKSNKSM